MKTLVAAGVIRAGVPVEKTAEEIRDLPTASKLRLAADILEAIERGKFASIDRGFSIARSVTGIALHEMGTGK